MGESISSLSIKCCCCAGKSTDWRPLPEIGGPVPVLPDLQSVERQGAVGGEICARRPAISDVEVPFPAKEELQDVWRNLFSQKRRLTSSVSENNREEPQSVVQTSPVLEDSLSSVPTDSKGRSGSDMFRERNLKKDAGISIEAVTKLPSINATVTQLGSGKWRIHGVHVERFLSVGLDRLDRLLGSEGVLSFPCTETGRPLLLRESLFRDLLTGQRNLKSVPQTDAAAAQKDLVRLSLRQLLKIRVLNLDFAAGGNDVHATFLSMVDGLVFERLGQQAAGSQDPAELVSAKKLGREMVLLVAAAKYIAKPESWVCWFEDRRIFFNIGRLACTEVAGIAIAESGAVLEFVDKSEPDRNSAQHRFWFDAVVNLVKTEAALSPPRQGLPGGSFTGSSLNVSGDDLKSVLGSLRKVVRS